MRKFPDFSFPQLLLFTALLTGGCASGVSDRTREPIQHVVISTVGDSPANAENLQAELAGILTSRDVEVLFADTLFPASVAVSPEQVRSTLENRGIDSVFLVSNGAAESAWSPLFRSYVAPGTGYSIGNWGYSSATTVPPTRLLRQAPAGLEISVWRAVSGKLVWRGKSAPEAGADAFWTKELSTAMEADGLIPARRQDDR